MTHRARGNFLVFEEVPPWLWRALVPREQKQRSKASPSAPLPGRGCPQQPAMLQPLLRRHLLHKCRDSSKQSFGNTFGGTSCLLVARREPNLPPSSFQHPEPAAQAPARLSWAKPGWISADTHWHFRNTLKSCTALCQRGSSAEEPCGEKHAPNLSTGTEERETNEARVTNEAQATRT